MAFQEWDVETTEEGAARYRAVGSPGVPVLVVDGEAVIGMDVAGWIRLLTSPAPSPSEALPPGAG